METDSYAMADACNRISGRALIGTIVMNCIQLCKNKNPMLIHFAYRLVNNVAHVFVQTTYSM